MDADDDAVLQLGFETTVIHWRGPSPYFYAPVPSERADDLRWAAKAVTYGWGMIPVEAKIAGVAFSTALFPKDETYLLPLKDAVRRKTNVTAGDRIAVEMSVRRNRR